MTEEARMILERLDSMSQDLKETKIIAIEARDAANEAKMIAIETRDAANEAKMIAIEARDAANEAKMIAIEARDAANEAKIIAIEARDAANEAKTIAIEALQAAKGVKASMDELNGKVTKLQTVVETEVCKKIDIIGDGHDFLKMNLDRALGMERERERMWLEILSLRMDMREVKSKLCVA